MNYYQRFMADYAGKTAHLSMIEDGAYNRLLDWQYVNEKPLPEDAEARYRIAKAMTPAERKAVDVVCAEFFRHHGWQARAFDEITEARAKLDSSRANGRKGGRPRRVPQGTNPTNNPTETGGFSLGSSTETQTEPAGSVSVRDTRAFPIPHTPQEETSKALVDGKPPTTSPDDCPHVEIVAAYHAELPMLRRVRDWNEARRALLRTRWRENPERQSVQWWVDFFRYVRKCPLLVGNHNSREHPGWQADLEWLVRPSNFVKVIEGKYEPQETAHG